MPAIKDKPYFGRRETRTRDGPGIDVLREGLPQEHAYDVVSRHALAIDESRDRLASAATTAGPYFSDDQRDHRREISHTLPPARATRFGS